MGKKSLIKNTEEKKANVVELFEDVPQKDRGVYMLAANVMANAYSLSERGRLATAAGKSFGGNRDLYNALGYKENPQFEDYYKEYKRGDIAKRVVSAFPDATWRSAPTITEDDKPEETEFEKVWKQIAQDFNVYHYLKRIDVLSGIGKYGVLLIGFDDGKELEEPVDKAKGLLYLRPYYQDHAEIDRLVEDTTDSRFGMPERYKIHVEGTKDGSSRTGSRLVHHSRVLHVAEDLMEDDIYANPRLEPILNRLQDLQLVSGGSAEMFWRGGFPGYAFNIPADVAGVNIDTDAMKNQIENYVHDLKRYMRLQGVEVQALAQQVASPKDNFEVLVRIISATTGIPSRILTGSERGQLASEQDETNWNNRVTERTETYAEPMMLRPFIGKLMDANVLPSVVEYFVDWRSMFELDEKDLADVNKKNTESLAAYANSPDAEKVVPPDMWRKKFLGFTDGENEVCNRAYDDLLKQEAEEVEIEKTETKEQQDWEHKQIEEERKAKYGSEE